MRSIGSVACTGALTVDFKLRYVPCTYTIGRKALLHTLHYAALALADALRVFMCFDVRLQKRILSLQKKASTCRRSSCQSRSNRSLSIGSWSAVTPGSCDDAQRTAVSAMAADSATTVAAAQGGASQGVRGVAEGPLAEDPLPPLTASRCRLVASPTGILPSSVRGGRRRSSVNEIQLGAERECSPPGPGVDRVAPTRTI